MIDVVLKHEAHLRIEDRAVLRHELELRVRRERPVLDLRAARERRRAHAARADRVHDRSESQRLGFAADRGELFVGQRLLAAA